MTTGIGNPGSIFCVCALNALQNSMMFRPRWPSAGPIGGLGFALPAGTCNLMNPTTFFAIFRSCVGSSGRYSRPPQLRPDRHVPVLFRRAKRGGISSFFHLREIELHRRRASEDSDRHSQLALLVVDVLHVAVEVREWSFLDAHRLAHLEQDLGPWFLHALLHLAQDRVDFLLRDRRRFVGRAADESRHLRRALHQVPGVVGHFHLNEHVAGKELALRDRPRAVLHLHHFLDWYQDLAELLGHARTLDTLGQRALDALLKSGVGVDDEPLFAAHPSPRPVTSLTSHASVESMANRTKAMTTTKPNTTSVVWIVSFRVGHETFPASSQAS